jgi:hypothetical protein
MPCTTNEHWARCRRETRWILTFETCGRTAGPKPLQFTSCLLPECFRDTCGAWLRYMCRARPEARTHGVLQAPPQNIRRCSCVVMRRCLAHSVSRADNEPSFCGRHVLLLWLRGEHEDHEGSQRAEERAGRTCVVDDSGQPAQRIRR